MTSFSGSTDWRARTLAFAVGMILVLLFADRAQAQASAACETSELTTIALKTARSGDEKARIAAARAFFENWRANLPGLMKELDLLSEQGKISSWSASDLQYATFLTDVVKTILSVNDQAIPLFRACDNERIIRLLVWASRGEDRSLRLNSANILANVVDNTTLCFVLHHLRDPSININGRANLLGVAVAVGSYAYKENVDAITTTLSKVKETIASSDDVAQTQKLIVELASRAQRSSNGSVPLPSDLAQYCKSYDYEKPLQ